MRGRRLSVWPPLPPGAHLRPAVGGPPPFPLADPRCRLFAKARHALFHGVRALGLGPGDQVLVPAYHHGSEIEALARAGLSFRWYEGDERLAPAADELDRLMGPRVRALYLIHYLGFPQDAAYWRQWCDDRHLLLLEDAAQAWLATRDGHPLGSLGDLGVFCLYKTIGVPEGAALVSRVPPAAPPADPRFGVAVLARRHGAWLAQRSAWVNALSASLSPPNPYAPARDRELGDHAGSSWRCVEWLLPRLSDPQVAAQRRAHYAVLLDALGDQVAAPFDMLPEGASPFAFPLTTAQRPALVDRLEHAGVRALQLWSVPHPSLPLGQFPGAAQRRFNTVGLPVHQELRAADLDTIAAAATGRPKLPRRLELEFEPVASLDELRTEWTQLAVRARNIFGTWEFAATWWRHFGVANTLLLHGARDAAGRLVAVLPVYRTSMRGLRAIRFVGHGIADELGPVCAGDDRAVTARALRRALRGGIEDWDLFVAERMPAAAGWDALVGAELVRRESSPVLRLPGPTWEDFLRTRSSNMRGQLRRRERKLRENGLQFRLADDPARLAEDLERTFSLHSQRWGTHSSAFSQPRRAFHRDFAALALERGWLRLWLAEIDGRAVAAWYGFRFAGAELFYQSGRDPAYDRLSVGFVLMAHTIRAAIEDGQCEYRLLRGDEAYKQRFCTVDVPVDTLVIPRGAAGRAVVAAVRGAARSPTGRRWVSRAVGGDPAPALAIS